MKKKVLFNTIRTSTLVVAAFAICALVSSESQAQCYGGGGGYGGYGGYGFSYGSRYGTGLSISYNSFRPSYGYSYGRPYYGGQNLGYGIGVGYGGPGYHRGHGYHGRNVYYRGRPYHGGHGGRHH